MNETTSRMREDAIAHRQSESRATILNDIEMERLRQITAEGYNVQHDDEHDNASLLAAAELYIAHARFGIKGQPFQPVLRADGAPVAWPWDAPSWKPKEPRRNLIRAAALIVAELERLDRL